MTGLARRWESIPEQKLWTWGGAAWALYGISRRFWGGLALIAAVARRFTSGRRAASGQSRKATSQYTMAKPYPPPGQVPCPGCGAVFEETAAVPDRPLNASGGCWEVCVEIMGFEVTHPAQLGPFQQLRIDAYGAQHPGRPTPPISVAYSLIGLLLAVERGWSGAQVQAAHCRMGKPQPWWPAFNARLEAGDRTALDVARAGVRVGSTEGHVRGVTLWAESVWRSWAPEHAAVAILAEKIVSGFVR